MRKVIIVDGTHLKIVYGGVLIVATSQDPNHHHYLIAFGVVDGEKDASWGWFLKMVKTLVPDFPEIVFLSDRNQSIIKCVGEVYPLFQHGYCICHLSQNMKGSVYGVNKYVIATKFMECAEAYTEAEFLKLFNAFRMRYPAASEYRDKSVEVNKLARCYFLGDRYNLPTTNIVESINGILKTVRTYAMLSMHDVIIAKVREWCNKRRKSSAEVCTTQKLVFFVETIMHKRCAEAEKLKVYELNSFLLEYSFIGVNGNTYMVDLSRKTCSCKRFDFDKYTCVLALAANVKKGEIEVHDMCSKYHWVEMWALAYCMTIFPVLHQNQWIIPDEIREKIALPPIYENKKGRNQEKMYPSVGEDR